jgi:phosphonate transport system substrate-binding protein
MSPNKGADPIRAPQPEEENIMTTRRAFGALALLAVIALVPAAWSGTALAQDREIRFGLIPSEDADKLIADSRPFIEQLEKSIGMKVKPFVAIDYSAVIEALKSDKLDIAFLGPNAYVLARDKVKAQVEPVARGVMQETGSASYKALIITLPNSPIQKISDLKGRTFALVDPASTSGNLVPRYVFEKNGINPERDFKSLYYSGTHQASLIAVKEGKVEAAAIADEVYNLAIGRGTLKATDLKVIYSSDSIPGSPFVIRTNLPKDLQDKLRKGIMGLKGARFGKLGVITEMDPATDADYNVVRELVAFQDKMKAAAKK